MRLRGRITKVILQMGDKPPKFDIAFMFANQDEEMEFTSLHGKLLTFDIEESEAYRQRSFDEMPAPVREPAAPDSASPFSHMTDHPYQREVYFTDGPGGEEEEHERCAVPGCDQDEHMHYEMREHLFKQKTRTRVNRDDDSASDYTDEPEVLLDECSICDLPQRFHYAEQTHPYEELTGIDEHGNLVAKCAHCTLPASVHRDQQPGATSVYVDDEYVGEAEDVEIRDDQHPGPEPVLTEEERLAAEPMDDDTGGNELIRRGRRRRGNPPAEEGTSSVEGAAGAEPTADGGDDGGPETV